MVNRIPGFGAPISGLDNRSELLPTSEKPLATKAPVGPFCGIAPDHSIELLEFAPKADTATRRICKAFVQLAQPVSTVGSPEFHVDSVVLDLWPAHRESDVESLSQGQIQQLLELTKPKRGRPKNQSLTLGSVTYSVNSKDSKNQNPNKNPRSPIRFA